jgi:hypothetical protein
MPEVLSNTIRLGTYAVPHKLILCVHGVALAGPSIYIRNCYTWCVAEVTKWLDYVLQRRCLVEMPGAAVGCWGNEALFLHVLSFAHGDM